MSVSDAAILRALCCGRGPCRSPGGCSVAEGAHPRNLLVWVEDALPALRAVMDDAVVEAVGLGEPASAD